MLPMFYSGADASGGEIKQRQGFSAVFSFDAASERWSNIRAPPLDSPLYSSEWIG